MILIVAVDKNHAIGKNNSLIYHLSEDMAFFKQMTLNKTIVMGRETLFSFKNQNPLTNRKNIVLSKNKDFYRPDITICRSLAELFKEIKDEKEEDVFIVGGESIYTQLAKYCKLAYITEIDASTDNANKFLKVVLNDPNWELIYQSNEKNQDGLSFKFSTYKNLNPQKF